MRGQMNQLQKTATRRCLRMRRKPGENHTDYLKRTVSRIKAWLAMHGYKPIHMQLLSATYREADRENTTRTQAAWQLLSVQTFRSRILWEATKDINAKRRRLEGFLQRSQGPSTYREDIFVQHLGVAWRTTCATMSWTDWKRQLPTFVKQACRRWGLYLADTNATAPAGLHVSEARVRQVFGGWG